MLVTSMTVAMLRFFSCSSRSIFLHTLRKCRVSRLLVSRIQAPRLIEDDALLAQVVDVAAQQLVAIHSLVQLDERLVQPALEHLDLVRNLLRVLLCRVYACERGMSGGRVAVKRGSASCRAPPMVRRFSSAFES
jgi:hypothetical protein